MDIGLKNQKPSQTSTSLGLFQLQTSSTEIWDAATTRGWRYTGYGGLEYFNEIDEIRQFVEATDQQREVSRLAYEKYGTNPESPGSPASIIAGGYGKKNDKPISQFREEVYPEAQPFTGTRERIQWEVEHSLPFAPQQIKERYPGFGDEDPTKILTAEEANARWKVGDLKFTENISNLEAFFLHHRKQEEIDYEFTLNRATGAHWWKGFGLEMATAIVDPIGLTVSAIIPPIGAARLAGIVGVQGSRVGSSAIRGTLSGMYGAASIEPLILASAHHSQSNYTALDSIVNIAFGGVLGGGLHTIGSGVVSPMMRSISRKRHAKAIDTAVKQAMNGEDIEVSPITHGEFEPQVETPINDVDGAAPIVHEARQAEVEAPVGVHQGDSNIGPTRLDASEQFIPHENIDQSLTLIDRLVTNKEKTSNFKNNLTRALNSEELLNAVNGAQKSKYKQRIALRIETDSGLRTILVRNKAGVLKLFDATSEAGIGLSVNRNGAPTLEGDVIKLIPALAMKGLDASDANFTYVGTNVNQAQKSSVHVISAENVRFDSQMNQADVQLTQPTKAFSILDNEEKAAFSPLIKGTQLKKAYETPDNSFLGDDFAVEQIDTALNIENLHPSGNPRRQPSGSHPGGYHIDKATGDEYYVKFPKDLVDNQYPSGWKKLYGKVHSTDPGNQELAYGVIIITRDNQVVLRQPKPARDSLEDGFGGYQTTYAKGQANPGETPEMAAMREVQEEMGIDADQYNIESTLPGYFHAGAGGRYTQFFIGKSDLSYSEITKHFPDNLRETKSLSGHSLDNPRSPFLRNAVNQKAKDEAVLALLKHHQKPIDARSGAISGDLARSEWLASQLYRAFGVPMPHYKLVHQNKKIVGIASSKLQEAKTITPQDFKDLPKKVLEDFWRGHLVDVMLANYDWVGNPPNFNMMQLKDGSVVRIDPGASLYYRAQGKKKSPLPEGLEFNMGQLTGKTSNPNGHVVYSHVKESLGAQRMTDLESEAAEAIFKVSPEMIDKLIAMSGVNDAQDLKAFMKLRRDALSSQYPDQFEATAPESDLSWVTMSGSTAKSILNSLQKKAKYSEDTKFAIAKFTGASGTYNAITRAINYYEPNLTGTKDNKTLGLISLGEWIKLLTQAKKDFHSVSSDIGKQFQGDDYLTQIFELDRIDWTKTVTKYYRVHKGLVEGFNQALEAGGIRKPMIVWRQNTPYQAFNNVAGKDINMNNAKDIETAKLMVGKKVKLTGAMSTALNYLSAQNFESSSAPTIKINLPENAHMLTSKGDMKAVWQYGTGETEVILPPNQTYRVVDVGTDKSGKVIIVMDMLPQGFVEPPKLTKTEAIKLATKHRETGKSNGTNDTAEYLVGETDSARNAALKPHELSREITKQNEELTQVQSDLEAELANIEPALAKELDNALKEVSATYEKDLIDSENLAKAARAAAVCLTR